MEGIGVGLNGARPRRGSSEFRGLPDKCQWYAARCRCQCQFTLIHTELMHSNISKCFQRKSFRPSKSSGKFDWPAFQSTLLHSEFFLVFLLCQNFLFYNVGIQVHVYSIRAKATAQSQSTILFHKIHPDIVCKAKFTASLRGMPAQLMRQLQA